MPWSERLARQLKLHDLTVLTTVAEAGSMGRAAQRLNTSQPSVSRAIADLEQALGVTLFERTPQGIEPTLQGRALLDTASSIFDNLRHGVQQIEALGDPGAGELRIGGHESIISGMLPLVFNRLRERYPRIVIQVTPVAGRAQQYAELRDRKVDLIVGRIGPPFEADVRAEVIYEEPTYVVAAASNSWTRRKKPFSFAELMDEPWALPLPNSLAGALFADAFRAEGQQYPPRCAVTGNIHLHCMLVAAGGFLAILPGSVVRARAAMQNLRVLPIESPVRPAPVGILRLAERSASAAAEHFVECARGFGTVMRASS